MTVATRDSKVALSSRERRFDFVGRFCETPRENWRLTQTSYNLDSVVISWQSFGAEGDHGIDFGGAARGDEAGNQ